jgi:predicted ATP-binding protein involved in virulence
MHIQKIEIQNLKNIATFSMEFEEGKTAGWHVLLGENGSGKATILQGIFVGLAGTLANVSLNFLTDNIISTRENHCTINCYFNDNATTKTSFSMERGKPFTYSFNDKPFLSLGFGTNRIFSGNIKEMKEYESYQISDAHSSLIKGNKELADAMDWLRFINYKALEKDEQAEKLLKAFLSFINESDLLNGIKIESVKSSGVYFRDAEENLITSSELSDGYQSIINLSFNIIYQMIKFYGMEKMLLELSNTQNGIQLPAIVLIDEADIHLHPSWQAKMGFQLKKIFPQIQFIVTTHSPLVCHAADTIWKLAKPGTAEKSRQVKGVEFSRLKYGNISESFETSVFAEVETQSHEATEKLQKLAYLNVQALKRTLTESEQTERRNLQQYFPTTAYSTSYDTNS